MLTLTSDGLRKALLGVLMGLIFMKLLKNVAIYLLTLVDTELLLVSQLKLIKFQNLGNVLIRL